jgi:hypothetical protein
MGIFSNCTQKRSWLSDYHLQDILSENQECSLLPLASVNLMSKAMFEKLGYHALSPTLNTVQLVDASI